MDSAERRNYYNEMVTDRSGAMSWEEVEDLHESIADSEEKVNGVYVSTYRTIFEQAQRH